jgi:CheY-like chemotaxis protein
MTRKHIVIIEDSRFIASVYRAKLQGEGYGIHVAPDGESGLELVDRLAPDLVIVDLGLPGMSGIEVLADLRAQARFASLPVFVLSGAYSQAIEDAWKAGATGVLSKSTDTPNKVVEVLRAALAA